MTAWSFLKSIHCERGYGDGGTGKSRSPEYRRRRRRDGLCGDNPNPQNIHREETSPQHKPHLSHVLSAKNPRQKSALA